MLRPGDSIDFTEQSLSLDYTVIIDTPLPLSEIQVKSSEPPHIDIKTENILVTSWNWLYLADFSSSYKPSHLPEDNPADFSYYFDTSGRRTCYLAPERFLAAGEKDDGRGVTWAMDIFSAGCVIAELFLEACGRGVKSRVFFESR